LVETAESAFRPRRSPLVKKINMHRLKPSVSAVPKSDHQRIHSSDPLGNSNSQRIRGVDALVVAFRHRAATTSASTPRILWGIAIAPAQTRSAQRSRGTSELRRFPPCQRSQSRRYNRKQGANPASEI